MLALCSSLSLSYSAVGGARIAPRAAVRMDAALEYAPRRQIARERAHAL